MGTPATAATDPREPRQIIEQMQADVAELRHVLLKPNGLTTEQQVAAVDRTKTLAAILGLLKRGLQPEGQTREC